MEKAVFCPAAGKQEEKERDSSVSRERGVKGVQYEKNPAQDHSPDVVHNYGVFQPASQGERKLRDTRNLPGTGG